MSQNKDFCSGEMKTAPMKKENIGVVVQVDIDPWG